MSLSRKAMLVCIVGCLAMRASPVLADTPAAAKTDPQTQEQTAEKRKTLMADATSAINETQNALKQLDDGKKQEALAALERATGKLEIILARDPSLTLAPAGVVVATVDLEGGIDAVKLLRRQAEDLIDQGRVQEARHVIKNLASETVVTVTNIPLATYPVAIKEAVKLIDDNKIDAAKRVLQTALNRG
jgi:YfdX protein